MVRKTTTGKSNSSKSKRRKIFVLDTSVLLFDHNAIQNFDEHDVVIPITVLEEIDHFKKGNDTINFEAREFTRLLDALAGKNLLSDWIPINGKGKGKFKVLMPEAVEPNAEKVFGERKADHRILNAAIALTQKHPKRKVTLVTKDINLRLKAKSLQIQAEDYTTGKIEDVDQLATGIHILEGLDASLIDQVYSTSGITPEAADIPTPKANQYFILKNGKNSALAYYNGTAGLIQVIEKKTAYGITPRNAEQVFAMHAVLNPAVRLVTITGVAGTGKTLLALAAALDQRREYTQIFLARPIVPLSNKDIGYLPGDVKSKLDPYMQPLWDNLKFIQNQFKDQSQEHKAINDMLEKEKLHIAPLAYIRGRSLTKIIFIVDEAQNLTPHEIKTIITRAGADSKIIFTGDVNQIDTPYLDSASNGLSYVVDRIKDSPLYAHVTLQRGERSELANLANDLL